jgi:glucose-6-phosphate 1-dehydrogenase
VTLVIFGGAGDLAHRKLLPALYNLYVDGLLPDGTAVVAVGRRDFSDDQFRALLATAFNTFRAGRSTRIDGRHLRNCCIS